jgi:preprotein translocase subunit YajC
VTAATAADLRAGAAVVDTQGGAVGTIESVDAEGAVVSTGTVRAKLPLSSFGRNDRGLVISLTRAQLEAAASAQTPS